MAVFSKVFALMSISALFVSVYGSSGTGTVGETEGFDHSDDDDDDTYCLDKLECAGDSLEADYVFCDGFYGCYEGTISANKIAYLDGFRGAQEAEAYSEYDVYCGGYISCFMSETTSMDDTICDGHTACYNAILYSYGDFYLYGYKAATATNIFGNSTDVSLYAYGAYSALYSVINDVETVYNYGLYGLYFADIFTDGLEGNEFTMYNYGRLSTYYAQLYCARRKTCTIYCRDFGCYGFEIWLARGSTVNVVYNDEDCDSSPVMVYARGYFASSSSSLNSEAGTVLEVEDDEFEQNFAARREMKEQAKKEFKKRYGREIESFKTEKEFHDFDVAGKFETIAEECQSRMGMIDGRLPHLKVYKTNVIDSNTIDDYQMDTNNVINVSNHGQSKFNFESAACGMTAGIILLIVGKYAMSRTKHQKSGVIRNNYDYQSINQ